MSMQIQRRHRMIRSPRRKRSGLILLVVLSMLAFLSLLVVTYIAFSSSARRTAVSLSRSEFRAPDVDDLFEDAMLKLVRGTDNPEDAFYGEDILSDYFGRKGSMSLRVMPPLMLGDGSGTFLPARRPLHLAGAFVRIPVDFNVHYGASNPRPLATRLDDYFAGRTITFVEGPLENLTFKVIRSGGEQAAGTIAYQNTDSFVIELNPDQIVTLGNGVRASIGAYLGANPHDVGALFYHPGGGEWGAQGFNDDNNDGPGNGQTGNLAEAGYPVNDGTNTCDDVPYAFHMNPAPLNAAGYGVSFAASGAPYWVGGNGIDDNSNGQIDEDSAGETGGFFVGGTRPPVVLFPNTYDGTSTIRKASVPGDFDENYDAADFNNWFLAGRVRFPVSTASGNVMVERVIPSFHRPAVINYLVNSYDWDDSALPADSLKKVLEGYRRATFRPLPFSFDNPSFTGGNQNYAIATPIQYQNAAATPAGRVSQLARLQLVTDALVNGPWDVDNDGDGVPDSVWIDLGLPIITSPEGKLIRPLIAALIEDTSSRLNVNAHGIYAHASAPDYWSNRQGAFGGQAQQTGQFLFRGLGFGPAEITFPVSRPFNDLNDAGSFREDGENPFKAVNSSFSGLAGADLTGSVIHRNERFNLVRQKYHSGLRNEPNLPVPGIDFNDSQNRLPEMRPSDRTRLISSMGQSLDPLGHGGMAVDRFGHVVATNAGTIFISQDNSVTPPQPQMDDGINDPYELDPTGILVGDKVYSLAEIEGILRSNSWDSDIIPQRLRSILQQSVRDNPSLGYQLTAFSSSTDVPSAIPLAGDRAGSTVDSSGVRREPSSVPRDLTSVIAQRLDIGLTFPTPNVALANQRFRQLVAPELRLGRKIDLNRALGNGADDNGNQVIDEPSEFGNFIDNPWVDPTTGATVPLNTWVDEVGEFRAAILRGNDGLDNDGDGAIDEVDERPAGANYLAFPSASNNDGTGGVYGNAPGEYAFGSNESDVSGSGRELLARHLYVLMMALKSQGYVALPLLQNSSADTEVLDRAAYDAHRIAQWAINVVDFRDPDSIMTRFVYDPEPLNGWDVVDAGGGLDPDARVVWGCESPELTFTESIAFHDVRVRDTVLELPSETGKLREDHDPATPPVTSRDEPGTSDTDSIRIPQGSLFMELYCNRQPAVYRHPTDSTIRGVDRAAIQTAPRELYDLVDLTGDGEFDIARLDLTRVAPIGQGQTAGAPVWRIAISDPHYNNSPLEEANPNTLRRSHPNTYSFSPSTSFEPDNPFEVEPENGITNNLTLDRIVLFRNYNNVAQLTAVANAMSDPVDPIASSDIFFVPTAVNPTEAKIDAGGYMVLAPRSITHLGSRRYLEDLGGGTTAPAEWPDTDSTSIAMPVNPSPQRFVIDATDGMRRFDITNNNTNPNVNTFDPPQVFKVKTFRPGGWAATVFDDEMVGLNVSEPLPRSASYYAEPTQQLDSSNASFPLTDAYVDFSNTTGLNATTAQDRPEDLRVGGSPVDRLTTIHRGGGAEEPFLGTQEEYCSAFLQRLADPLRPHDVNLNPYMTVDWMTIDLTVFSGEESPEALSGGTGLASDKYAVRSRQRDGEDASIVPVLSNSLFSYSTKDGTVTPNVVPADAANYFQFTAAAGTNFDATLGILNYNAGYFGPTLGASAALNVRQGRGQPQAPFATLDWLNRPFASHYELMMVPATSPARLFQEFSVSSAATPFYPPNGTAVDDAEVANFQGQHRHLLNFFQGSQGEDNTAQFPRLFDYVTTLPRFRGEVELRAPARFTLQPDTNWPRLTNARNAMMNLHMAPFCFTHDNVRQGQINLNTVSQFPIWQGLMQGHMTNGEFGQNEVDANGATTAGPMAFGKFLQARRGYDTASAYGLISGSSPASNASQAYNFGAGYLDGDVPTQFARPFRDMTDADIAPEIPDRASGTNSLGRSGVDGSLLRRDRDMTTQSDADNPLFVRTGTGAAHESRERNAFMKYQTLMRMPNLVSKQSNVLTMRLTMGFFEVDAATLSLGREYKEDIAENQRHRMLYIIDRSKPVGFKPGEDLNVRDAVVYERALE